MSAPTPTFSGEVQFAGYSDSSRSGPRVTLRLQDRAELEKFVGCEGRRYMAVLVEIGDDEKPVGEPQAQQRPTTEPQKRMGPLCEWAVMRCKEPQFRRWVAVVNHKAGMWEVDEACARDWICAVCYIESRKELDANEKAAALLHELVRKPYAAWLKTQEATA